MEHLIEKIDELTKERDELKGLLALVVIVAGGEVVVRRHHLEAAPPSFRLDISDRQRDQAVVVRASREGWRT